MKNAGFPARLRRLALLTVALSSPAAALGQFCGSNEPAVPVPECRSASDGTSIDCADLEAVRLWPDGFRPGLPGQTLPPERDSTQWRSFSIPGFQSGHELFHSLDIVDDFLYVAYNAGLQVWDIAGTRAEDPRRLLHADGWDGGFFQFPSAGENDFFVDDVAAIDPVGGNQDVLIALSGKDGVGLSIWEHRISSNVLAQLYQDLGTDTRQARVIEFGAGVWAFGASPTGVFVYDLLSAKSLESPCLDDAGSVCAGVFVGKMGTMNSGGFVSVIARGGKLYVAASDGSPLPSKPLGVEIWELSDPANPAGAILRFSGLSSATRGTSFFAHGGSEYLAGVERIGASFRLAIYDVSACLNDVAGDGCDLSTEPPRVWSIPRASNAVDSHLTFSTSNGTPYLFYGLETSSLAGTKQEGLFDLSDLGLGNQVKEITEIPGVRTYVDSCTQNAVDYWGDYYADNGHGLRSLAPRVGKFRGLYFYRAAYGVLDVHVRDSGSVGFPVLTTTAGDSPPYYMDEPIGFTGTAQNCSGPENWAWNHDDTLTATIDASGSAATLTFGLCSGPDCPDRQIEVWTLKDACSADPGLIESRATVTVQDPRAHIRSIIACPRTDPGCMPAEPVEFPVCSRLRFTADVDGRSPFTYLWEIKDSESQVVTAGTLGTLDWNTDGARSELALFTDGFESGDLSAWGSPVASAAFPAAAAAKAGEAASGTYDVELTVTNLGGGHQTPAAVLQVTLTDLGVLGFSSPEITPSDQGGGLFDFQAQSQNATEWRWEVEDPENGDAAGCQFYSRCRVLDWGTEGDRISYQWAPPNEVPATLGVTVSIRNCVSATVLSASTAVVVTEVTSPEPPAILSFTIDDPDCTPPGVGGTYGCPPNDPIDFEVSSQGFPDTYEFDWDGDGSYDEQLPADGPITHTYESTDTYEPRVRALAGSQVSAPVTLDEPVIVF